MNKYKRNLFIILICVFTFGFVYGSYKVFTWKKDNDNTLDIKNEIDKSIDIVVNNDIVSFNIDFDSLKRVNKDTVAYLKVNNTNIDYVVVKGNDNSYYLKHNLYKKKSSAGWVFADYHNKFDGSDKNIVIYGHNMKSGIMFGSLKKVLNEKWYLNEDNRLINLITTDKEHLYYVFSVYKIKKENYYINTKFKNNFEFLTFINTLSKRSIYNFGVKLDENDKILTLSTCSSGSSYRTVLHAKLIK